MFYGPMPIPQPSFGARSCSTDDGSAQGADPCRRAGAHALSEQYDEAFSLLNEADRIFAELGEDYVGADNSGRIRGLAHLLSGDREAAEAGFRDAFAVHEHRRQSRPLELQRSSARWRICRRVSTKPRSGAASPRNARRREQDRTGELAQPRREIQAARGAVEGERRSCWKRLRSPRRRMPCRIGREVHLDVASVLSSTGRRSCAANRGGARALRGEGESGVRAPCRGELEETAFASLTTHGKPQRGSPY